MSTETHNSTAVDAPKETEATTPEPAKPRPATITHELVMGIEPNYPRWMFGSGG